MHCYCLIADWLAGGYLVDDTSSNRGTFCAEPAVVEEVNALYGFPLSYVWKPNNKTEPPRCKFSRDWVAPCMRGCCAQPPCGCNKTAADEFWTDMLAVFRALHVVANSGPTAIGGGGKRRRPPAPPLCPPPLKADDEGFERTAPKTLRPGGGATSGFPRSDAATWILARTVTTVCWWRPGDG